MPRDPAEEHVVEIYQGDGASSYSYNGIKKLLADAGIAIILPPVKLAV